MAIPRLSIKKMTSVWEGHWCLQSKWSKLISTFDSDESLLFEEGISLHYAAILPCVSKIVHII